VCRQVPAQQQQDRRTVKPVYRSADLLTAVRRSVQVAGRGDANATAWRGRIGWLRSVIVGHRVSLPGSGSDTWDALGGLVQGADGRAQVAASLRDAHGPFVLGGSLAAWRAAGRHRRTTST
jgi:hypothetical protein